MRFGELLPVLYVTSEPEIKRFMQHVEGRKLSPEDELTGAEIVQICLLDWFAHHGALSDAQQLAAIKWMLPQTCHFASYLGLAEQWTPEKKPTLTVSLSDYRFISVIGKEQFFDAKECDIIAELPVEAVTHVMCDITALVGRMIGRVNRIKGGSHDGTHHPANPEDGVGDSSQVAGGRSQP